MSDVIRLLLIEDEKDLQEVFLYYIEKKKKLFLARITGSQSDAISRILQGEVDAVILDLELEEGDGIHFLEELTSHEMKEPLIIVFTNNRSKTVNSYVKELGADFICYKENKSYTPERILDLLIKMYPYHRSRSRGFSEAMYVQKKKEEEYRKERILRVLHEMGIKVNSKAEHYLLGALYYTAFEIKEQDFAAGNVYIEVAKIEKTKPENVEKGIRVSIERIWSNCETKLLEKYYPYPYSHNTGLPTNSQFILNMSKYFKGM